MDVRMYRAADREACAVLPTFNRLAIMTMNPRPAVRARGITKAFGNVVALDGIDLDVAAGQIHGLVGPNGAGKTTLLGILLGLAVADSGELEILGVPAGRALSTPNGVSGFVDGPGLYPALTARQNLTAVARMRGTGRSADVDEALDQVGMTDMAGDRVRGFSLGMRQRLGLASALLTKPRLLILDEPGNGLDPAGARQVRRILHRLADDGTTVMLSSHRMDDVQALCSEVTLVANGRVVFTGPLAKLSAENRELDCRIRTSDPAATREMVASLPGVDVVEDLDTGVREDPDVVVVRVAMSELEELFARLLGAGIGVSEFAPVVSPLESAFLALTQQQETSR
jgi:ABC-2 type transport system ATP-binding protein